MKNKLLFILPILILASCQGSSSGSYESVSGLTSAETSVSSQTSSSTEGWNNETTLAMENALGKTIPFLDVFSSINYSLSTGFMASSNVPYVNPYWIVSQGSNWCEQYRSLLISQNYEFVDSDVDPDDETCIWYNHEQALEDNALNVRYAYYQINNGSTYYFEIYAWLDNSGGGISMPSEVDFTFLPETFGTSGTSYANATKEIDVDGVTVHANNIMNQSNLIQLKKQDAKLNNLEAMRPIKYLYLEGINDYNSSDYVEVKAGTSLSSLAVISTFNGVYNLNGATYFEIATNNRQVVKLDSIQLLYV